MINFRYHVVSLTAVFLALAIGLVVGTAALNGPVANDLSDRVNQLTKSNSQYRAQVNALNQEVAQKEQFATDIAPELLAGKLAGRRVVVVSMSKSSDLVQPTIDMLTLGGATVTGQIEIEDSFVDAAKGPDLLDLAEESQTTDTITGLPSNSDGVETSTALFAAVLTDHTPVVPQSVRENVLKAYASAGYLSFKDDSITSPAEAVVFLGPLPYTDTNASTENAGVVTIVSQFATVAPTLVGADGSAGSGNIIGAITGDQSLAGVVSTVDNVGTPQGRVAAVLALSDQLDKDQIGHYGLASSATSLVPETK